MRVALKLVLPIIVAVVASFATASPAGAAACPTTVFLRYGYLIYASSPIPSSVSLAQGEILGTGEVDEAKNATTPNDNAKCERERNDVQVVRLGDVDPRVAVGVKGKPGLALVLGGRCTGFEGDAYWSCLLDPLEFDGTTYTGVAYPAKGTRGAVTLADELGTAKVGGETVTVKAIDGVDPSVAVGIEGHPNEAYLAPDVCPYERFSNTPAANDLARCLSAPVWLVFDPPGARVGTSITAYTDRPVAAPVTGSAIELVRSSIVADVVPQDRSGAVQVATVPAGPAGTKIEFDIPNVDEGIYEAVVTCNNCAASFGKTTFPSGSLVAFKKKSSNSLIITIIVVVLLVGLFVASIVMWKKGFRYRRVKGASSVEAKAKKP